MIHVSIRSFFFPSLFTKLDTSVTVVSPISRFALGRFSRESFRPNLVGRFAYIFIQALWIEVRYVLVYKGVEGVWGVGVHLVIALACLFSI